MSSKIIKSLAFIALAAAGTSVMAQANSGGVSGVSGVSGGLGIDFAAGQSAGSNHEKAGGFASAIEAALGNPATDSKAATCEAGMKCK